MSMNMSGDDPVDYADFEYQHIAAKQAFTPSGQGARVENVMSFAPLESKGGLDNDEVAELVYLETHATLEYDDETADQNVGAEGEFRGIVGSNLGANAAQTPNAAPTRGQITNTGSDQNVADERLEARTITDPAIFQQFKTHAGVAFDDEASGAGGAASHDAFHAEKNWRTLTGRGPVLDSTDDLDVLARVVLGDHIVEAEGNARLHCVWDVVEMDDAGQRFSVPK
jgi:hypothetical protein